MSAKRLASLLKKIQENDVNYEKRTKLVYQALAEAAELDYTCGIRFDSTLGNDSQKWPVVVIQLPTGSDSERAEVAWHCAASDLKYDGHSDEEKFARIVQYCSVHDQ